MSVYVGQILAVVGADASGYGTADALSYVVSYNSASGVQTIGPLKPSNTRPASNAQLQAAEPGSVCLVCFIENEARVLLFEGLRDDGACPSEGGSP